MFKVPLDYQCAIVVHAVTHSASSCPAMLGRLQELQEEGQPAKRDDRSTVTNSVTEQLGVKFRKESLPQSYGSHVGVDESRMTRGTEGSTTDRRQEPWAETTCSETQEGLRLLRFDARTWALTYNPARSEE